MVKTFSSDAKTVTCRVKDKVKEIKFERNLLGRMLSLAVTHKIDIESIMKYPLTPVPLSLFHIDGSIMKTAKSIFFNFLEKEGGTEDIPSSVDCTIIDGFFFMHLLAKQLPPTFGNLSRHVLMKICKLKGNRIDLVFDQFLSPSIKNIERQRRGGIEADFAIVGESQKAPNDFAKALRNNAFKVALVEFFVQNWNSNQYAVYIGNKTIYVNCGNVCYKYYVDNGNVQRITEENLYCEHEEADSRIVFHTAQLPENTKVIIKASDTDVLIILLGNLHMFATNVQIWMDCGLLSKNNLRLVDVNKIGEPLGPNICKSLPAYHAFTGCDYTAAFSRKGKLTPFKLLQKNMTIQNIFSNMGETANVSQQHFDGKFI